MRLNRFLAQAGVGSRRSSEDLVRAGRVTVNGELVTNLATQIGQKDAVKVDGRLVRAQRSLTALLHKPPGYICSASDESGRETIFDLLPRNWPRLFHVGRLDKESEGLLIVTNDGDLALQLTHPKFKIEKEYEVDVDRPFSFEDREKLLKGFHILGGRAKAERLNKLSSTRLRIVLRQGIKRQIRLMLYELGYEVKRLVRTRIGKITLDVPPGKWRLLSEAEIASLSNPVLSKTTKKG